MQPLYGLQLEGSRKAEFCSHQAEKLTSRAGDDTREDREPDEAVIRRIRRVV